jgi:hypothetical protein
MKTYIACRSHDIPSLPTLNDDAAALLLCSSVVVRRRSVGQCLLVGGMGPSGRDGEMRGHEPHFFTDFMLLLTCRPNAQDVPA